MPILAALGQDVLHGRRVYTSGTSDRAHVATAARLRRILITHDQSDVHLLHRAWRDWIAEWGSSPRPEHAGILRLPQTPKLSPTRIAEVLDEFVQSLPTISARESILQVESVRGWEESG